MLNQAIVVKALPPGSAMDAQDRPGKAVKHHLGLVGILLVSRAWLADPDTSGWSSASQMQGRAGLRAGTCGRGSSHLAPGLAGDCGRWRGPWLACWRHVLWRAGLRLVPPVGEDRTANHPGRILGSGQESLSASLQST